MIQVTSKVFDAIVALLSKEGAVYKLIEHGPVITSYDAAQVRGINISQGAKSILLSADGSILLVVVPGDRRIDFKSFKKQLNIRDLRMCTPSDIRDAFDLEVGAIPPFGNLLGVKTYADRTLLTHDAIFFNAGSHTRSIRLETKDYIRLVQPHIGDFIETK